MFKICLFSAMQACKAAGPPSMWNAYRRFHGLSGENRETTVIVGAGQLSVPTVLESLSRGNKVIVCASKTNNLNGLSHRLEFVNTSYQEGKDPAYWENFFRNVSQNSQAVRVVNARGVSSPPKGETYKTVFYDPSIALLEGFARGVPERQNRIYVLCSSSTASVEGFPEKNAYAFSRSQTDQEISKQAQNRGISGGVLRFDLVVSADRSADTLKNPNHGASFKEFALDFFHPVIGHPSLIAIQPICETQAAKGIMNISMSAKDFPIINAVGKKAYTQEEAYQFYANLFNRCIRLIHVPFSAANWAAKHIPFAQIHYGVDLLEHRASNPALNRGLDHKPFEHLVGDELRSLEEIHASQTAPIIGIRSPTALLITNAVKTLLQGSRDAKSEFVKHVLPHFPHISMQLIIKLLKDSKN